MPPEWAERSEQRVAEFADALRGLKGRARASYAVLADRSGISRSALHRYCSGASVPAEFAVVERFARCCGASRAELVALHRLWALAGAAGPEGERAGPAREVDPALPSAFGAPAPPVAGRPAVGPPASAARRTEPSERSTGGPSGATGGVTAEGEPAAAPPRPAADTVPPRGRAATQGGGRHRRWLWRGSWATATALATAAVWLMAGPGHSGEESRLLLSDSCRAPLGVGDRGVCVAEVHRLLAAAGAQLPPDGKLFDGETRRRVVAYQALAGQPANGVVNDGTKRALYDRSAELSSWPPQQVTARIEEVFSETPVTAVAFADCQSRLDPLWAMSRLDSTRTWGVFQLSDGQLADLDADPAQALDPEWNIQAAHRLWSQHGGFEAWPECEPGMGRANPQADADVSETGDGV